MTVSQALIRFMPVKCIVTGRLEQYFPITGKLNFYVDHVIERKDWSLH